MNALKTNPAEFFNAEAPALREQLREHFGRAATSMEALRAAGAEALVLGGGYGRGEGGVLRSEEGTEKLFNDLDYFLFCANPRHPEVLVWVTEFERSESAALGVDVEVKCLRRSRMEAAAVDMLLFDLALGHHVVWGPSDYLRPFAEAVRGARLPLVEATRLLWNRGSGLFFAQCAIAAGDAGEVAFRNLQKAKLALGDAWLLGKGEYTPLCADRAERVAAQDDLPSAEVVSTWHREAAAFKERPHPPPPGAAIAETAGRLRGVWITYWLALESARLGHQFESAEAYAKHPERLFPESPRWRNLALALRDRLRRGAWLHPVWDYPRSALMRALPLLVDGQPEAVRSVHRFLPPATDRDRGDRTAWRPAYERWWQHYG